MSESKLAEEVKCFIANELREPYERLGLDTRIQNDLWVDGADGWELMAAFWKQFDVDPGDYDDAYYFGDEGGGCLPTFFFFWLIGRKPSRKLIQITVQDMVVAAKNKRWTVKK